MRKVKLKTLEQLRKEDSFKEYGNGTLNVRGLYINAEMVKKLGTTIELDDSNFDADGWFWKEEVYVEEDNLPTTKCSGLVGRALDELAKELEETKVARIKECLKSKKIKEERIVELEEEMKQLDNDIKKIEEAKSVSDFPKSGMIQVLG